MNLDKEQQEAVERACSSRFSIINGGAGCGKTTIIREICKGVANPRLCAFTGKAAARIREATGFEASTIHRMLGYNGDGFLVNSLSGKDIVIDEASMLDTDLLYAIMERGPSRLVLVGDEAQLPPVGSGQPFHDIVRNRPDLVTTLKTCYRASGAVHKAANAIRGGFAPQMRDTSGEEWWEIVQSGADSATHNAILEMVRNREIDFTRDAILVPKNSDSPCTVDTLNRDICDIVNPHSDGERFRPNDRVMCLKNHPELDVWNGTTGSVEACGSNWMVFRPDSPVRNSDGELVDEVDIPQGAMPDFQLAYAMTVHKAQGSQYNTVVFAALCRDTFMLLDRSMLYTAVTRAKKRCVIAGQYRAIQDAIRNSRTKHTVMQYLFEMEKQHVQHV